MVVDWVTGKGINLTFDKNVYTREEMKVKVSGFVKNLDVLRTRQFEDDDSVTLSIILN